MSQSRPTIWESLQEKGYSRREFVKFCGWIAAAAGISSSSLGEVVFALENKPRPPVVWFHFQECTCCSESFIRSSHPIVADILLDHISLDYSETLQAAAGDQAEEALHQTMKKYKGQYIVAVEGSIPTANNGVYCCIGGRTSLDIIEEAAENAFAMIAWGNCAYAGCVQAAKPNPTDAKPLRKVIGGKPIVNVPGCPPIAEVMVGTIVHLLTFERLPQLDSMGRPLAFYSKRVHDTCYRRANYDAGLFAESFDDENARKGYCLYKLGCRGPVTYNACAVTKWNEGTSFPIQSGHGCIGCSEAGNWDNAPLYNHLPDTAGFGIEGNADKIGIAAGIATGVGIAAHAVVANLTKQKKLREQIDANKGGD
ncbi:MAG: hydrogenase small subunit [Deltaproteobacteria bacterium]|nr:hydrogenase small subunit [Deltaproteobacteria bacterium]